MAVLVDGLHFLKTLAIARKGRIFAMVRDASSAVKSVHGSHFCAKIRIFDADYAII
jgi:hypothetical protein